MERIDVSYQVTLKDFRMATYFGMFQRYRNPLRIMFVVLIAAGVYYFLGTQLDLGPMNYLVFFLAAAYLLWGLVLFAGAENGIRTYLRSENSMIGCTYHATLDTHRVRMRVSERKIDISAPLSQLACVFEISTMFLIYVSAQDAYILPHRCLTEEQRIALRENFRERMGEYFNTRFK